MNVYDEQDDKEGVNSDESSLKKAVIEATTANDLSELKKLLSSRDDQKLYGQLIAEVAAANGHLDVFDLLRSYGIIDVGDALHKAGK